MLKFDIIDYIGKYEGGILTLITLEYNDEYYDATFYYKPEFFALTITEEMEIALGYIIEEHEGYNELLIAISERVVPYDELIDSLDEIEAELIEKN